jgi:Tol biopolymer transport system component
MRRYDLHAERHKNNFTMINILKKLSIFIFFVLNSTCINLTETDGTTQYEYPLCIIGINGENFEKLSDEDYDGAGLYFINDDSTICILWGNGIYNVDLDKKVLEFKISVPIDDPGAFIQTPDYTSFIAIANNDLFIFDNNGENLRKLTNSASTYKRDPYYSSEGRKIIFTSSSEIDDQKISYYDFEKDSVIEIISHADDHRHINPMIYFHNPVFGKNDEMIYYLKSSENRAISGDTLYSLNLSDMGKMVLDTEASFIGPVIISENKKKLVYLRECDSSNYFSIAVFDCENQNILNLDDDMSADCDYKISKDGEKILYWDRSYKKTGTMLFIINSDGSNRIKLSEGINASFSSDEKLVVFAKFIQN